MVETVATPTTRRIVMEYKTKTETWCGFCGKKVLDKDTKRNGWGAKICPDCGKPVRTRPHPGIPKAERHYIEVT
jgi:predicted amidophosphoribosyltransferase